MTEFQGKSVLVTGGGSGIGAAIARRMAAGGAKVVVADIEGDRADAIAAELAGAGAEARPCRLDVAVADSMRAAVDFTLGQFGRLDFAVNNAGIAGPMTSVVEYDEAEWRRVIDINLTGVFLGLKYQIPAIQAAGCGAIVNMASMFGAVARRDMPAYIAAKHGVVGLTKAAALECAGLGVRVNAVGPGVVDTPLLQKHAPTEEQERLRALHPIGRLGRTEDIAELTAFLLSDRASFITGSLHLIDGGWTAQ